MTFGVQIMGPTGSLLWDSNTVVGGIVVDFREYAANAASDTVSYPSYAGYTAYLLTSSDAFSLSTASGYPVVTSTGPTQSKSYALAVY